jgi:hypothetical protein
MDAFSHLGNQFQVESDVESVTSDILYQGRAIGRRRGSNEESTVIDDDGTFSLISGMPGDSRDESSNGVPAIQGGAGSAAVLNTQNFLDSGSVFEDDMYFDEETLPDCACSYVT